MTKGERLTMIRNHMRLSQKQMGERLDLQQAQYSRLENNKSGLSDATVSELANMGFNVHWLFTGDGEMLLTDTPEPTREEGDLAGELEERIRRIKIDVSDIEDTVRRWIQKKR